MASHQVFTHSLIHSFILSFFFSFTRSFLFLLFNFFLVLYPYGEDVGDKMFKISEPFEHVVHLNNSMLFFSKHIDSLVVSSSLKACFTLVRISFHLPIAITFFFVYHDTKLKGGFLD